MKENRRFIIFGSQGARYALPLQDVAEVMEPPLIYPIPRAPQYFAGAINFHGGIVSLVDLAALLETENFSEGGKILVLDRRIANLAFRVESVQTIISADAVLEEDIAQDEMSAKLLILADGTVKLLNLDAVLDKLEGVIGAFG